MNDIVLYAFNFRSRSERVIWAMNELDLEFSLIRIDPFDKQSLSQLLKINPEGKVPVLIHDNNIYTESLAIIEHLNTVSIHRKIIPTNPDVIYVFRKVIQYGLAEIEPYLWIAEQAKGPLKKHYNWPDGVYDECIRKVKYNCEKIKSWSFTNYLAGPEFSMADIFFYHLLTWAKQHNIDHAVSIETYLAYLEKRDSFPKEMHWR